MFEMPGAALVLKADFLIIAADLLFRRGRLRGGKSHVAGGKRLGKDIRKLVSPTAIVLDDHVDNFRHIFLPSTVRCSGLALPCETGVVDIWFPRDFFVSNIMPHST